MRHSPSYSKLRLRSSSTHGLGVAVGGAAAASSQTLCPPASNWSAAPGAISAKAGAPLGS